MRRYFFGLLLIQLLIPTLSAQEWIVPADKKGKLSTFPFNDETRKAGEKLYSINCMSCHGTPGKANYLPLVPPPGDPATEKIQKNNDGEIFYKVSVGRGQMPSFRSVLTSNEIWNVVSFLRSFNTAYKQQVMPVITSSAYPGAVIGLLVSFNPADSTIILKASATSEKSSVPVADAEVKLLVKRTFGMLPVDEPQTTDKEGLATFRVPADLKGDTAGMVLVSARFTDEDVFGSAGKDTLLNAGQKVTPVSLVAQRAMWNNVRKAPVWIILAYGLGVLIAWGFILLVLMKLRDIYLVGEIVSSDKKE
ncbi:MAG: c-type cytochrome [Bacteroidales bacterium]|nr:c-type cytochrome [Bacteroidales bacterium]